MLLAAHLYTVAQQDHDRSFQRAQLWMLAWWKGKIAPESVCHDLIEFSDFFPTIVEAGQATLPTDHPIDGRSFLPRLKGEPYTPRESVFVHYDKNPESLEPEFRRVRFAYDGRYKLYLDGQFFDIDHDYEEQNPLPVEELSPEILVVKNKLQATLDLMPPWTPDNAFFKGKLDQQTTQRAQELNAIPEQKAQLVNVPHGSTASYSTYPSFLPGSVCFSRDAAVT